MHYPRVNCGESRVEEGGGVTLKRNNTMAVPFLAPLLLALPTNHAIYAFAELGRYWRELKVWLTKKETNSTTAQKPVPPTVEQASADGAEYAAKYTTKIETATNTAFMNVSMSIFERMSAATDKTPIERGKMAMTKVMNYIHGQITYASALTSLYLCGHGDSVLTHNTAVHSYDAYTNHLHDAVVQTSEAEISPSYVQDASGGGRVFSHTDDYKFRDNRLSYISPWMFTAWFSKSHIDDIGRGAMDDGSHRRGRTPVERYMFSMEHPQNDTHMLKRRPNMVLPQAIRDLPARPSAMADPEERENYARFALFNFTSDRTGPLSIPHSNSLSSGSLPLAIDHTASSTPYWDVYVSWMESTTLTHDDANIRHLIQEQLSRIDTHAMTRLRGEERRVIRRQQQNLGENLANANPHLHDSSDDSDDMMIITPTVEYITDDGSVPDQVLIDRVLCADMSNVTTSGAKQANELSYVTNSLSHLTAQEFKNASREPDHATTIRPLNASSFKHVLNDHLTTVEDFCPPSTHQLSSFNTSLASSFTSVTVLDGGSSWRLDVLLPSPTQGTRFVQICTRSITH